MKGRRAAWLNANGPCGACGSGDELEVDHVDPSTKGPELRGGRGTYQIWSWSAERLRAELAKCQVLCEECHLKKSIAEGSVHAEAHGTESRYRKGCKCDECRAAHAARMRHYRENRRARADRDAPGRSGLPPVS